MKKFFRPFRSFCFRCCSCSSWSLSQCEINQKFDTGDYTSTLTEAHVGYKSWESPASSTSGWSAIKLVDDGDNQSLASGKVGIKSALTDEFLCGEVKAYTGDEYTSIPSCRRQVRHQIAF